MNRRSFLKMFSALPAVPVAALAATKLTKEEPKEPIKEEPKEKPEYGYSINGHRIPESRIEGYYLAGEDIKIGDTVIARYDPENGIQYPCVMVAREGTHKKMVGTALTNVAKGDNVRVMILPTFFVGANKLEY